MEVFTIGFTQTTAADFFGKLRRYGIRRLVDVRLNNISQLAAFAKRDDLAFFLKELCGAEYLHEIRLAPTQEMLDAYKKQKGSWNVYASLFLDLMKDRRIETELNPDVFDVPTALLCSEPTADHCHRRLVLDYLQCKWSDVRAVHL